MLGFQAKARAMQILDAAFADVCAAQEIARVELDAWFGGADFQKASRIRFGEQAGIVECAARAIQRTLRTHQGRIQLSYRLL